MQPWEIRAQLDELLPTIDDAKTRHALGLLMQLCEHAARSCSQGR